MSYKAVRHRSDKNLHWSCPWSSVIMRICWFSVIWFCNWLISSAWLVAVVVSCIITRSLLPIVALGITLVAVCRIVFGNTCGVPTVATGTIFPSPNILYCEKSIQRNSTARSENEWIRFDHRIEEWFWFKSLFVWHTQRANEIDDWRNSCTNSIASWLTRFSEDENKHMLLTRQQQLLVLFGSSFPHNYYLDNDRDNVEQS